MKRFTDTAKWDDPWFRSLTGVQKLVFLYVIDRCNNAGFWEKDLDSLAFHTRLSDAHIKGAWEGLTRGLLEASGWVWVRRFLRHQKNEQLSTANPAHKQIIALISEQHERFQDVPEFLEFEAPYKGLISPIGKGIGKGKKEGAPRKESETDTDEDWIQGLEKKDCYRPVDIRSQLGQAQTWCETNHRQCTRKFFFNWLSKALTNARTISVSGRNPGEKTPAAFSAPMNPPPRRPDGI